MPGSPAFWTDERVDTLKTLWADGLTASQISSRLRGTTRNSVIGKVHRLGLSGRVDVRGPLAYASARNKAGKPQIRKSHGSTSFLSPLQKALQKMEVDPIPTDAETDNVARISWNDMEPSKHCRRIPTHIDPQKTKQHDPQFCGKPPVPGLPYCLEHSKLCYAPPRPVSPRTDPIPFRIRRREFA